MTDLMLTNLPVLASADGGLNYLHGLLFRFYALRSVPHQSTS